MAKKDDEGVSFDGMRGAHRPLSGAETSTSWSSAAPIPQCPVRVGFQQRQGSQMATASYS